MLADFHYHAGIWRLSATTRVVLSGLAEPWIFLTLIEICKY